MQQMTYAGAPPAYDPNVGMMMNANGPFVVGGQSQGQVVVVQQGLGAGMCPQCRVGIMASDFTCCGIALAILFFPWGLICCFLMKQYQCRNCGFSP